MRQVLLIGGLALCACSPLPPKFPVGFFGVKSPADVALLAEQGFNAVQSYQTDPASVVILAAETRYRRQLLLISPQDVMASTHTAAEFPGVIWYLQDEPDIHGVSRDQLFSLDRRVKSWASGAKTAFVVGDGRFAKNYPNVSDVIMVDWYPVPHLPLESAGDHIRWTAEVAGRRPVWAVLQAMDWRDFPQSDSHKSRIGRFPTEAEIRFMSYDAILNGASGIWYFTYRRSNGQTLSHSPHLMENVVVPAREIATLAPIVARGRGIAVPFQVQPDGPTMRAWTYAGRDYILVLNRHRDIMEKIPNELLSSSWRPLFKTDRDVRKFLYAAYGAYYMRPYQAIVFESRLRLSRLLEF